MNKEGCVFYFFNESVEQTKKEKPQKIYKIVKLDFFVENELTNQKKIDNRKNYYYLCENSKELTITELDEDSRKIKGKNRMKDNTILLQFEDRKIINLKTYLKELSSSTKYILTIINFYKYLLNSINLLVNNNIFHNHINFDSIVVDKFEYPLLTDFSFSIDYSRNNIVQYIKHFIIAYDPSYLEWPIELHILSYLLTNKLNSLSSHNIENIIHEVIKNNIILNTFNNNIVSSFREESLQYFKKYVNQSYDYILTDILQYSHTWDNYALSILFLRMLIGIHRTIEIKNKFIILFMKLLVYNIHCNPSKRMTIDLTIIKFDSLLDSLEPKDYKNVINGLMSA
jgi:hypothetical protein